MTFQWREICHKNSFARSHNCSPTKKRQVSLQSENVESDLKESFRKGLGLKKEIQHIKIKEVGVFMPEHKLIDRVNGQFPAAENLDLEIDIPASRSTTTNTLLTPEIQLVRNGNFDDQSRESSDNESVLVENDSIPILSSNDDLFE